jgi:DNA primase
MQERKLSEQVILKFNLGYVDKNGETYIGADFTGTLPPLDKRFYHSTMFPIFSAFGECIAVSCRPLNPSPTKYINSTYDKAKNLYGLSVTWQDCLREKSVYVVEGNISLLQMYQAGIKNCVAMLGSNLSTFQVALLNRYVTKIVMVPDSDIAGMNVIEKLKKNLPTKLYDSDIQFTYVKLPPSQDPDDYFKQHTKEEFLAIPQLELNI